MKHDDKDNRPENEENKNSESANNASKEKGSKEEGNSEKTGTDQKTPEELIKEDFHIEVMVLGDELPPQFSVYEPFRKSLAELANIT